jgi:tetratricopeptide (TPR) repeat protein
VRSLLTGRANPDRSFDAACRHLFRHVWNPEELRRNPIVAYRFDGGDRSPTEGRIAEEIRAAVRRHADECLRDDVAKDPEIARRRHSIIVDGDLGGTPRTVLAERLGISTRQYSRDQRQVRRRIVALLRARLPETQRSAAPARDVTLPPLSRAAALVSLGMPNEALENIDDLVRTANTDATIALALCLRSAILGWYFSNEIGASGALLAAQTVSERLSCESDARVVVEAEVGLGFAELDALCGRLTSALQRLRHIQESLDGFTAPDSRTPWLIARTASWHAYVSYLAGDARSATQSLERALKGYRAAGNVLSQERAEFLVLTAIVLKDDGRHSEASHHLREATTVAQQNALAVPVLFAEFVSGAWRACGEPETCETVLSPICEEAEHLGHAGIGSAAHLYVARCHLRRQLPRPLLALSNVKAALRLCPVGGPYWIDGKVTESRAKVLLGDLDAAEDSARVADEAAALGRCNLLRSSTLRAAASVAHAQGRAGDARDLIQRAIDVAYNQRQLEEAAQAHEIAAMITGRRNHRLEAKALRYGRRPAP